MRGEEWRKGGQGRQRKRGREKKRNGRLESDNVWKPCRGSEHQPINHPGQLATQQEGGQYPLVVSLLYYHNRMNETTETICPHPPVGNMVLAPLNITTHQLLLSFKAMGTKTSVGKTISCKKKKEYGSGDCTVWLYITLKSCTLGHGASTQSRVTVRDQDRVDVMPAKSICTLKKCQVRDTFQAMG